MTLSHHDPLSHHDSLSDCVRHTKALQAMHTMGRPAEEQIRPANPEAQTSHNRCFGMYAGQAHVCCRQCKVIAWVTARCVHCDLFQAVKAMLCYAAYQTQTD